jgi:hypothetical protein
VTDRIATPSADRAPAKPFDPGTASITEALAEVLRLRKIIAQAAPVKCRMEERIFRLSEENLVLRKKLEARETLLLEAERELRDHQPTLAEREERFA